jgi:hypothetical protein
MRDWACIQEWKIQLQQSWGPDLDKSIVPELNEVPEQCYSKQRTAGCK